MLALHDCMLNTSLHYCCVYTYKNSTDLANIVFVCVFVIVVMANCIYVGGQGTYASFGVYERL